MNGVILKKWKKNSTHYTMKVNFDNNLVYTDILQITLHDPWLLPKYKDNFAGINGLRLYGWLFFYFGRYYGGILYPAFDNSDDPCIVGKDGKRYYIMPRDKVNDFEKAKKVLKRLKRKDKIIFSKQNEKEDGSYNILCSVK